MRLRRIMVMFTARNREFFRDRAAFGWNFFFPFLLVVGFAIMFGSDRHQSFKIGLFPQPAGPIAAEDLPMPPGVQETRYLSFIGFSDQASGMMRLQHHKIDLLVEVGAAGEAAGPANYRYWVSDTSPKGYIAERLLREGLRAEGDPLPVERAPIQGYQVPYIDWLFPGILAMNMMFSALYGVGFVVVRYRKNGVLKRLKATPLSPFEYLTAQMLSRLFLLMFSLVIVWICCAVIFRFRVVGSYLDLLVAFLLGGASLTAMGLVLAARGTSEEFTNGVLNFLSWPMMFLSEVWFSLEGAPEWVRQVAACFPLTHLLSAVREIMNEGATLTAVAPQLAILTLMTVVFLTIGALRFSWTR
ncbi:MAG: ABC transporter permease [Desulfosarcinaceae bacterium]|nr:ABC transporter permease [Desulfosarcinaceae bacterium]